MKLETRILYWTLIGVLLSGAYVVTKLSYKSGISVGEYKQLQQFKDIYMPAGVETFIPQTGGE